MTKDLKMATVKDLMKVHNNLCFQHQHCSAISSPSLCQIFIAVTVTFLFLLIWLFPEGCSYVSYTLCFPNSIWQICNQVPDIMIDVTGITRRYVPTLWDLSYLGDWLTPVTGSSAVWQWLSVIKYKVLKGEASVEGGNLERCQKSNNLKGGRVWSREKGLWVRTQETPFWLPLRSC